MSDYREIKASEVMNGGFKMELIIPVEDAGNIDALVDQDVIFKAEGFIVVGVLEKTQTLTLPKEEGVFKKLAIATFRES